MPEWSSTFHIWGSGRINRINRDRMESDCKPAVSVNGYWIAPTKSLGVWSFEGACLQCRSLSTNASISMAHCGIQTIPFIRVGRPRRGGWPSRWPYLPSTHLFSYQATESGTVGHSCASPDFPERVSIVTQSTTSDLKKTFWGHSISRMFSPCPKLHARLATFSLHRADLHFTPYFSAYMGSKPIL